MMLATAIRFSAISLLAGLLLLVSLAPAAMAGGAPPPSGDGHGSAPASTESTRRNVFVSSFTLPNDVERDAQAMQEAFAPPLEGRYVDLPTMNVPIVQGERLLGYAFILVRLNLPSNGDEGRIREEIHILLDQFIRAAHRVPFTYTGGESFQTEATEAEWYGVIAAALPAGAVTDLDVVGGDVNMLVR